MGVPKGVSLSHKNIATEVELLSKSLNISKDDIFFSSLPLHCASECICGILFPLSKGASISFCKEIKHKFEISGVKKYYITESSSIVAIDHNGLGFQLLPGMRAKISNPDPETGIGEICLAGDNIMMGYCDDPETTAKVLKNGWLYTGDLGWIEQDKYIHMVGRKDNVIITNGGNNVYPEELEKLLNNISYINE